MTLLKNISGIIKKSLLVIFVNGFLAWAYQAACPPPPKKTGSPDGPPITNPRIKLRDGRHLSYREYGVPKEVAKYKIIYVHGFDSNKHFAVIATSASSVSFFVSHLLVSLLGFLIDWLILTGPN